MAVNYAADWERRIGEESVTQVLYAFLFADLKSKIKKNQIYSGAFAKCLGKIPFDQNVPAAKNDLRKLNVLVAIL